MQHKAEIQNTTARDTTIFIGSMGLIGLATLTGVLIAVSPVGQALGGLINFGGATTWHLSRATGVVGYLLLTSAVAWGLILSTKISKELTPPPLALAMHRFVSWTSLAFSGLHAYLLLFDKYYKYTLFDILVPFAGPYKPAAVALGMIGFYISLLASMSFAWKKWLGQKNWRRIHMLTFPAFGMITLHGLIAGSDSGNPGMLMLYLGSTLLVLFLTNYRLLSKGDDKKGRSRG